MKNNTKILLIITVVLLSAGIYTIAFPRMEIKEEVKEISVDEVITETISLAIEEEIEPEPKQIVEPTQDNYCIEANEIILELTTKEIEYILKNLAVEEWGNDYSMVEYQYDKQLSAYNNVRALLVNPRLNGTINELLIGQAILDWELDFSMVWYSYEKQLESWENMQ